MANILRTVDVRVDRHIEIGDLANTGEIDSLPQVDTKRLGLSLEAATNNLMMSLDAARNKPMINYGLQLNFKSKTSLTSRLTYKHNK